MCRAQEGLANTIEELGEREATAVLQVDLTGVSCSFLVASVGRHLEGFSVRAFAPGLFKPLEGLESIPTPGPLNPIIRGQKERRPAELSEEQRRFHEIRCVVSDLGVFDFQTDDHRMRLRSLHPGATVEEVVEGTGFEVVIPDDVPESRLPTEAELAFLREGAA